MKRPSLAILDVGHGNAAVLADTAGVVVIDCGRGGVILDYLKSVGIFYVDTLLISHADEDHIGSAPHLILDRHITVGRVYFNSDPTKHFDSRSWKAFRRAIQHGERARGLKAYPSLVTSMSGDLDQGAIRIEILFPPSELAASGPGGSDLEGRPVTSNSMSVAILLKKGDSPQVLLAADIELDCVEHWSRESRDVQAPILVFPHHGGLPGQGDPVQMAEALCRMVRPESVLFSVHRSQHGVPRTEVINSVRGNLPSARIACTQISAKCASELPREPGPHLVEFSSLRGKATSCCAGTIVIDLSGASPVITPSRDDHRSFIDANVPTPMCGRAQQ